MTESNICCSPPSPFHSQSRYDFLRNHCSEPIQSSAPSRLENFDELYLSEFIIPANMKGSGTKTNSLNSLFSNTTERTLKRLHSCDSPSFSITSSDAPDSPELLASPTLDQKQMFLPFLEPADAINIKLRNFESIQPSFCNFASTIAQFPLQFDCSRTFTSNPTGAHHWKKLNDCNTANLTSLKLEDTKNNTVNKTKEQTTTGQAPKMKDSSVDEKVLRNPAHNSCEMSFIFPNKIFDQETEDSVEDAPSKQMVYRSLSDSLVHRRHRQSVEPQPLKRRKSVHFADTSGYELEIHIPIRQSDDYKVPPRLKEALEKIRSRASGKDDKLLKRDRGNFNTLLRHFSLVLNFQQPFLDPTFQRRVQQQNVCLESISVLPNSLSFTGVVRVINLEFEKLVTIRYSTDRWKSYKDIPACYVATLSDARQDQFSFHVVASDDVINCGNIEIAVRYILPKSKRDYWDNNYRHNYVISCLKHGGNSIDDRMMT